jgi:hypothetical protein
LEILLVSVIIYKTLYHKTRLWLMTFQLKLATIKTQKREER